MNYDSVVKLLMYVDDVPNNVMKRSKTGPIEARPGYILETCSIKAVSVLATIAPPTGTRKFLSVLCINASTRPCRQACSTRWQHFEHCKPYALFITCGTSFSLHILATT